MNQFKLFLLFLLFCFSSCAPLIPIMEVDNQKYKYRKDIDIKTICKTPKQFSVSTESSQMTEEVGQFFKRLTRQRISLTFIEKLTLLSLIQMKFSPLMTSPTSRYMALINIEGKQYYFDFTVKEEKNSLKTHHPKLTYLYALESLLKKFPSHKSLEELARIVDQYTPKSFKINKKVASRLQQYGGAISSDKSLKKYYFHDDEIRVATELLPSFNMTNLIKIYQRLKRKSLKEMTINQNLIPFKRQYSVTEKDRDSFSIQCNQDFEIYKNSIYKIASTESDSSNFGLTDRAGNTAIVTTGQTINQIKSLNGTPFILSKGHYQYSILCNVINHNKRNFNFSLIVTKDRDPAQNVFHLFKSSLSNIETPEDFDGLIQKARFLFLKKPLRILIESKKMHKDKLKEIMKIDGPIYHSSGIGEIWSYLKMDRYKSYLMIDGRYDHKLYCSQDK